MLGLLWSGAVLGVAVYFQAGALDTAAVQAQFFSGKILEAGNATALARDDGMGGAVEDDGNGFYRRRLALVTLVGFAVHLRAIPDQGSKIDDTDIEQASADLKKRLLIGCAGRDRNIQIASAKGALRLRIEQGQGRGVNRAGEQQADFVRRGLRWRTGRSGL